MTMRMPTRMSTSDEVKAKREKTSKEKCKLRAGTWVFVVSRRGLCMKKVPVWCVIS